MLPVHACCTGILLLMCVLYRCVLYLCSSLLQLAPSHSSSLLCKCNPHPGWWHAPHYSTHIHTHTHHIHVNPFTHTHTHKQPSPPAQHRGRGTALLLWVKCFSRLVGHRRTFADQELDSAQVSGSGRLHQRSSSPLGLMLLWDKRQSTRWKQRRTLQGSNRPAPVAQSQSIITNHPCLNEVVCGQTWYWHIFNESNNRVLRKGRPTRSAPVCSNTSATSVWPFSHAYVRAVSPVAVVACTLAPAQKTHS